MTCMPIIEKVQSPRKIISSKSSYLILKFEDSPKHLNSQLPTATVGSDENIELSEFINDIDSSSGPSGGEGDEESMLALMAAKELNHRKIYIIVVAHREEDFVFSHHSNGS